jgi:hypothetical protein
LFLCVRIKLPAMASAPLNYAQESFGANTSKQLPKSLRLLPADCAQNAAFYCPTSPNTAECLIETPDSVCTCAVVSNGQGKDCGYVDFESTPKNPATLQEGNGRMYTRKADGVVAVSEPFYQPYNWKNPDTLDFYSLKSVDSISRCNKVAAAAAAMDGVSAAYCYQTYPNYYNSPSTYFVAQCKVGSKCANPGDTYDTDP